MRACTKTSCRAGSMLFRQELCCCSLFFKNFYLCIARVLHTHHQLMLFFLFSYECQQGVSKIGTCAAGQFIIGIPKRLVFVLCNIVALILENYIMCVCARRWCARCIRSSTIRNAILAHSKKDPSAARRCARMGASRHAASLVVFGSFLTRNTPLVRSTKDSSLIKRSFVTPVDFNYFVTRNTLLARCKKKLR